MSIALLGYIAVCLVFFALCLQIRNSQRINQAETHMAKIMRVSLTIQKLEDLRDKLLELKALAIKAGFNDMERFYDIEHQMNLLALNLNRIERQLIAEGLQQPSGKGRLEYMLKLVNLSIAATVAH